MTMATNFDVCAICGVSDSKLGWDHDHKTGLIRGRACERCNPWIYLYERDPIGFLNGPKQRYRTWFFQYRERILNHLGSTTGVPYELGMSVERFKRRLEELTWQAEAAHCFDKTKPKLTKQEFAKFIQRNRKDV